ncbi:MAG: prepilin-type N-terminal cleavage/methylation domain-containing protein [Patescibacteria group bacterium]|nr:prepilin-type N-terminal cleavage/methylation domain-containing protein [Patescibacteria group bacterium]
MNIRKIDYNFTQFKNKNLKRGFSLIEVLIVIIMIITIISIGSFEISSFYRRQNLNDSVSKIAFALRGAREKAISQENGQQWGIHFDNTESSGFYALFSGDTYSFSNAYERIGLNENIKFLNPPQGFSIDVKFSKFTGLPSTSSSIIISLISNPSDLKTINMNSNGEVLY